MFVYFIPLTVNLTKNSKLKKFVHGLNALWKLSGSSLGALRDLVAVAGIKQNILILNNLYLFLLTVFIELERGWMLCMSNKQGTLCHPPSNI
jgi:hypothetical protein